MVQILLLYFTHLQIFSGLRARTLGSVQETSMLALFLLNKGWANNRGTDMTALHGFCRSSQNVCRTACTPVLLAWSLWRSVCSPSLTSSWHFKVS